MKTALQILKRDLLALVKNPIALLVVCALLVLPGLYAWYCIVANWDPYANTGRMPIAVVNEDKGASSGLTGEVNVGQQVVDKLKDNDSIDWRFFESQEEALAETSISACYATIVLPEDLSENVVGIFEGSSKEPKILYYPNEKQNAVATKVTDSATQTLIRQIDQSFSSTVNETILISAQKVNDQLEEKADEASASALDDIHGVQADLGQVVASLDDAASSIGGWREAARGASVALEATAAELPAMSSALERGSKQVEALRADTAAFESGLSSTVLNSAATVSELSARADVSLREATNNLKQVNMRLEMLEESTTDADLQYAIQGLEVISGFAEAAVKEASSSLDSMNANVQETMGGVTATTSALSSEVAPQLNVGSYELAVAFSKLSGAVGQFEPQIAQLQGVLAQTDSALADAAGAIVDAKALLSTISANLDTTVADLGTIGNALQIDQLAELLDVDPQNVGTFVSSPVHMVTEEIFPVSNYGTAVAPFYTNLALWIGCFILVSLMKVEVDRAGFEEASATQRYFGRWFLFVILSLLQSQVICGVDLLLGIDCVNPVAFMVAGAFCSFAYMNLIFALVITFRNIGKTLCIVLLIMQVPGSSGMYPIQMMPEFFQIIHPALPFTYGIDAMREALCGMYETTYVGDLLVLVGIVPASLIIGLLLRPYMMNLLQMFDEEMCKVGFFASEQHGQGVDEPARSFVRALAAHDSFRDGIEERAWAFNRVYPRLRRVGSIAAFAIPFGFLVVILPFNLTMNLSTNVKLTSLMIVLVLTLLVSFGLIVLEYVHRIIVEETRLLGMELLGDGFGYETLAEQADHVRQEREDAQARAVDQAARELLNATPPLSDSILAMLPTSTASPKATSEQPAHAKQSNSAPKRYRGATRDIFLTDIRLGFQSVIGVVVIVLLVITPSLYAWFNIAGSWDPYSNTGNLKVAVANEDEGYKSELIPITINIGDTVVSQLRGNNSFDWEFVSREEAIVGVESSDYYAAVEIPSDFSRNMMTYITENGEYPNVTYYTNEKENPIAPIITQKGADSIQENIRRSFTERVDEVVLGVAYDILDYVTNPRMSEYVKKASAHLDDATRDSKSAARELRALSGLTHTVSSVVDTTGAVLENVQESGNSVKAATAEARSGAENASSAFERAMVVVEESLSGRELDLSGIEEAIEDVRAVLYDAASTMPGLIDVVIGQVEEMHDLHPGQATQEFADVLQALEAARTHAAAIPGELESSQAELDILVSRARGEIDTVKAYFQDTVKPAAADLQSSLGSVSASASSIVGGLESTVGGISSSTSGLSSQLDALSVGLARASDKLQDSATGIEATKARIAEALASGDVRQLETVLLGADTERMAARLAAPILEERMALYPVSNYGSSMAPFYTVLSLWVGALVMISTMRAHVAEDRLEELRRRYARVGSRHEFFGRYGIFGFISLLQSALVLLGDLTFLHIQCVHPILFLVFGLFIGQVFTFIVYTFTELFGDVGKAVCVILLIMQVAASGGTFPVEMLDPLLSALVPFLPFFHAMSLLQECVAGIFLPSVAVYVIALLCYVAGMILIGVVVRKPFRKLNDFFEEQLERTGYM